MLSKEKWQPYEKEKNLLKTWAPVFVFLIISI